MKRKLTSIKLFFILFILLISKNNLFLFFKYPNINNQNYQDQVLGKVLYQNPYKYNEELIISTNDTDIEKNSYVTFNNRLIGVVDKVYKKKAIIKLITSKDFILQVKVNDCYGILKNDGNIYVSGINNYCTVNNDALVYTSNLGYSKENIYIGKIIKIEKDFNEINKKYYIDSVNINNVYYVTIERENKL